MSISIYRPSMFSAPNKESVIWLWASVESASGHNIMVLAYIGIINHFCYIYGASTSVSDKGGTYQPYCHLVDNIALVL